MFAYVIRRLIQGLIIMLIVTLLVFIFMRLVPGDPLVLYIGADEMSFATPERIAALRAELGLDKPAIVQYFNWLGDVLHGDLGVSVYYGESVWKTLSTRLPITVYLGTLAFLVAILIGIPLGVISAVRRGTFHDTGITLFSIIGITLPTFWLGILMAYLFGLKLGWLSIKGFTFPFDDFLLSVRQVIMPVICLSVFSLASNIRQTRSSMLEVMRQDYIRTAWSKGLKESMIITRHALKNGLIPVITLMGMHVRMIFGGSVLVETVFNIPGMGRLLVDSIIDRDFTIIQGCILVAALVVTLTNLAVDISYGWLDPRIQYK